MSGDPDIVKARGTGLVDCIMTTKPDPKEERAARLAAQLRANLHRRKEQARGSTGAGDTKGDDADAGRD